MAESTQSVQNAAASASPTAQRLAERLNPLLEAAVAGPRRVPGVVAGVTDRDETLYLGAAGVGSLAERDPLHPDSLFAIYSTTKALTATLAMQLWEQGSLDLDAPASNYAPALADIHVIHGFDAQGEPILRPPLTQVTTRQLLTHTAGFGYDFFNATYARLAEAHGQPSVVTCTPAALRTPLLFEPGTQWEYGSNIDWAGQVIEGITGQRLSEALQQHILTPLGIQDATFAGTPEVRARMATIHQRETDQSLTAMPDFFPPARPEVDMGGHGLITSVGSYLAFIRMWLNEGRGPSGVPILRPETVAEATRDQTGAIPLHPLPGVIPALSNPADFFPGQEKSWSLAFMRNEEDAPTGRPAGSSAWSGLANLYYWIDASTGVGGYWATQIFPFFDPYSLDAYLRFEKETYRALR